jgi:hypothetical protein
MECLGLHNKPKAEVHPGHMLTGPKEEEKEEASHSPPSSAEVKNEWSYNYTSPMPSRHAYGQLYPPFYHPSMPTDVITTCQTL